MKIGMQLVRGRKNDGYHNHAAVLATMKLNGTRVLALTTDTPTVPGILMKFFLFF